jgi:hypothetical protein
MNKVVQTSAENDCIDATPRMLRLFTGEIESFLRKRFFEKVPGFSFMHGSFKSDAAQEACSSN